MTDMITAQFIRELPNGEEFNYQFHITEYLEERDNFGVIFQYHFAHFMAQYTYLKDKLNKEKEND